MIDLFLSLSPCQQPDVLQIIRIIKTIMQIICIVIPICVFIFVTIDFVKNVIASSEKDIEGNTKLAIKRILMGVAVFLVPTIVMAVNNMLGSLGVDYASCLTNATKAGIAKAKVNYKAYQESLNNQINNTINNNKEDKPSSGGIVNRDNGFSNLKGHTEDNNSSGSGGSTSESGGDGASGGGTGGTRGDNSDGTKKVLYVGDSRTVGMCNAMKITSDCIAEEGKGLSWLKTKNADIKRKTSSSQTTNPYNVVVFNLGVNDCKGKNSAANYAEFYNQYAEYNKNVKVVVTSVTQVLNSVAKKNGYTVINADIISFNKELKNKLNSNVQYCDVYGPITGHVVSSDGMHYDNETYKLVYETIQKCVNGG